MSFITLFDILDYYAGLIYNKPEPGSPSALGFLSQAGSGLSQCAGMGYKTISFRATGHGGYFQTKASNGLNIVSSETPAERGRQSKCCSYHHSQLEPWSSAFLLGHPNEDGFHEQASTRDVARFHGSLWGVRYWLSPSRSPHRSTDESVAMVDTSSSCPYCGELMHRDIPSEEIPPDVVTRTDRRLP